MQTDPVDVLVVGAGPAGCVAAIRLAHLGRSVLLVDRALVPAQKICGEYLCPSTVAALDRLNLLDELPADALRPIHGMRLVSPGGEEVATRFPCSDDRSPALSVSRPHLEDRLQTVAWMAGVQLERGVTVLSLTHGPKDVEVGLQDRAGRHQRIRTRMVVGADGRHSVVARRCGLARRARGPIRGVVHAWYEGVAPGDCGEMHFFRDGSYLGLDPLADGRWNAGWVTTGAMVAELGRAGAGQAALEQLIAGSPSLRHRFADARLSGEVRTLMPLRVDTTEAVADQVVLVGDAAGFYDPLTGEGIHAAVVTADLAAPVIHEGLTWGQTDARFLARYARQRRRFMRRKWFTHQLLQALLRHPGLLDHIARSLRRRPDRGHDLIGVIGQLLPVTRLLRPCFWAPLLAPTLGAPR